MKVYFGADHGGVNLKDQLVAMLKVEFVDLEVEDFGTFETTAVDYPHIAEKVASSVAASPENSLGVVVCGSGIGVSIAANKVRGIRCALVHDSFTARVSREHNNANMIALGERVIGSEVAKDAVRSFLHAKFQAGRHATRVALISEIETRNC